MLREYEVSGHDFSRAVKASKSIRGFSPCHLSLFQASRALQILLRHTRQSRFYRIVVDICAVLPQARFIDNTNIGETTLPNLAWKPKLTLSSK